MEYNNSAPENKAGNSSVASAESPVMQNKQSSLEIKVSDVDRQEIVNDEVQEVSFQKPTDSQIENQFLKDKSESSSDYDAMEFGNNHPAEVAPPKNHFGDRFQAP